jgi:vitamin B12/bleomycin/antimicrobial peptide transport system ATP-binding/permease protein
VVGNWLDIMQRTKKLTAFTATYSQAAVIFPYVLIAPAYFANKIQLGGMMQTASAFSSVQDSLSFFITAYRTLAEWQSVVARLDGFEGSIRGGDAFAQRQDIIRVKPAGRDGIELDDLVVTLPDGKPLLAADGFKLPNHQRTLVTGPSGAGKSTLFRAIAGIWPFGKGAINVPANASLMMLPQHPYLPIGSLHDAVVYPGAAAQFDAGRVREILTAVGLPQLAARLAEEAHWNRMLSLGEQQRLGIARALLHQPQFLFLDEATASLDEPSEAALYRLLADSLPDTAVVSIGHRSTLDAFHQRNVALVRDGDRFTLHDRVEAPAS